MNKLYVFFVVLTLFLAGCGEKVVERNATIKSVKVMVVDDTSERTVRHLSGTLVSASTSQLSFRVSGLIELLNVRVGDSVNVGDVVARLTQKEFNLNRDSAQAKLNSARSNLIEKQDELARQKQLKSKGFVAQVAVEQAQASYNQAKNNVEIAKTDLDTALNNLSYTTLKSPVSGRIAQRLFEPFAEISAGQPVYEIQSGNELEVEILVPETMINDISYGDIVTVAVPSVENGEISATISEIGTSSVAGNAYQVTVVLSSKHQSLRAGMTARVGFNQVSTDKSTHFLIPVAALDTRVGEQSLDLQAKKASVFVVENGIVVRKVVTVDDLNGNELQVIDGLSIGDQLIVAGVTFIKEGQQVNIWQPTYNLPAVITQ